MHRALQEISLQLTAEMESVHHADVTTGGRYAVGGDEVWLVGSTVSG
ncbi:hypothetical protein ACFSBG_16505 [Georgenia yuyongxinii]|nr:hypothetical protein [Georgenia yuyongxinii]